jgi:hypothetical protein
MIPSARLPGWFAAFIGTGLLALVLAFVPSPLRLFDMFDEAEAPDVPEPPLLKLALMPPVDNYAPIIARPIFNAGRLPDPASNAATSTPSHAPAQGDLSEFRLIGIVSDSANARALLVRGGAPAVKVAPGDKLGEWRIEKIDGTGVLATNNGRKTKIVILKSQPRPATP